MKKFLSAIARPWSLLPQKKVQDDISKLSTTLEKEIISTRDVITRETIKTRLYAKDAIEAETKEIKEFLKPYLPERKFESFDVLLFARFRAALTSADYFNQQLYDKPTFKSQDDLILHCLSILGDSIENPLEFGVYSGRTINLIADNAQTQVYGFDSFEGLPETWRSNFPKGRFSKPDLPVVRDNVTLIKGWFEDTVPSFASDILGGKTTNFLHIDCDLYSSTKTVLQCLDKQIARDAVIIFDEFFNYPGWENHEIKAFMEFIGETGRGFHFIGCVPGHQQVAVRLSG